MSIASVSTMQISMQHEQIMNSNSDMPRHQKMMNNMSVKEMKDHCQDILKHDGASQQNQDFDLSSLDSSHHEQNHDQQMQDLKDCHSQLIQSKQIQHSECQDCASFSCQSSIVWFNSEIPKLFSPKQFQNIIHQKTVYQAHDLNGYWQEILRPPKV